MVSRYKIEPFRYAPLLYFVFTAKHGPTSYDQHTNYVKMAFVVHHNRILNKLKNLGDINQSYHCLETMTTSLGNVWPTLIEVNRFIGDGGLRTTFVVSLSINFSQQQFVQNLSKVVRKHTVRTHVAASVENRKHKIDFNTPHQKLTSEIQPIFRFHIKAHPALFAIFHSISPSAYLLWHNTIMKKSPN